MKIRIGIVGYGNLGKAVEEEILKNKNFELVAIFSRRLISSSYNTMVEPYDIICQYKKKIDILLLCGSSSNDIESQLPELSKYFYTINSFDNHTKLKELSNLTNNINKKYKTISISACGWDPGLFSIIRTLMYALSDEKPVTFWGKGISMGHSDALRRVDGVIDGVQFTVPNKEAMLDARKNKLNKSENLHFRECYILTNEKNTKNLVNNIKNIPNYFKGQQTNVSLVSAVELSKLKKNMKHQGRIFSHIRLKKNKKASLEFMVKMSSNPIFTAKIMTKFVFAMQKLKKQKLYGSYLPIDIPVSYLISEKYREFVIDNIC